jgi:hypothetical protein
MKVANLKKILSIFYELISFFLKKKKYWIIPMLLVFFIIGSLLFFTQGTVYAPFIYTLF